MMAMMIDWCDDSDTSNMKFSRATRDLEIFRADEELTKAMIEMADVEWNMWNYWCLWIDDVEEDAYDLNFYRLNGIMMVSIDEKKKMVRVPPLYEEVENTEEVDL